jgi:hypothetical protein
MDNSFSGEDAMPSPNTGIIQLSRSGDLLNILPLCKHLADHGDKPTVIVHRDYAPILEGVSYADVYAWTGDPRGVGNAATGARPNHPRLLVTQCDGNPALGQHLCRSYVLESWRLANAPIPGYAATAREWQQGGHERAWRELPLVFDRRCPQREAALWAIVRALLGPAEGGKPLLLLHLDGISSPFLRRDEFLAMARQRWGDRYAIFDLGRLKADRLFDLLGLLDRAAALIAIDSAILHLSYATRTPTVALQSDTWADPWYRSEPRVHWLARWLYGEAMGEKALVDMDRMLSRPQSRPCPILLDAYGEPNRDWFFPLPKPFPDPPDPPREAPEDFAAPRLDPGQPLNA